LVLAVENQEQAVLLQRKSSCSPKKQHHKEGENNEEEVPRIRVGRYLALHIGNPGICETPS
jgi:hypothetical protein